MNFYDSMEKRDYEKFIDFSEKTNLFESSTATTRGASHDVSATTRDNRIVICELKSRFVNIDTYNDIFIEPIKVNELIGFIDKGIQSLYINFFDDGKVAIWNFKKPLNMKYYPKVRVRDYGDNKMKEVPRFSLLKEEAIIYKKTENGYERDK